MKKLVILSAFFCLFGGIQGLAQTDNCLQFDGVDDYVLVGDVNDLGTSDFTLEAWVYIYDAAGVGHRIITKGMATVASPPFAGYGLRVFDNEITSHADFHVGHSDGSTTVIDYTGMVVNQWYHLAGVRQGTNLYLYVDGVEVATGSTGVVYDVDSNLPLAIGAVNKGGSEPNNEFLNGRIDEARIWNVARTPAEINDNMNCAITAPEAGLLAVYNFNEITGLTAFDSSGFANDGALIDGPIWIASDVAPICCQDVIDTNLTIVGDLLTSDHAGATYQWINCATGVDVPGAINQFYDPPNDDEYAVVITDGLCTDTSECKRIIQTGISEEETVDLAIYPNPTNSIIKLSSEFSSSNYSIYDLQGKIVLKGRLQDSGISVESLGRGKYLIEVQAADQSHRGSFVKL